MTVPVMLFERRLTTAEILYHYPDHPSLLQSFVWQHMDVAPKFPRLMKFLDYWESLIDGRLHSVRIAGSKLYAAKDIRVASTEFRLQ